MAGLEFSVPYNNDPETLTELFKMKNLNGNRIREVYLSGPQKYSGSGRIVEEIDEDKFVGLVERIHGEGLRVDLVINSTCEGLEWYKPEVMRDKMEFIGRMHQKHGVEGLTIANPLYISEVKKNFPDLEISASVLDDIDCAHKAKMYSELGADIITPDGDVNRDLETLRKMKKAANAEFKLMLNDGCLYKCPFRRFHFNYISHKSVELGPVEQDIFTEKCGLVSLQDRSQILKSGWIRPEDMEHYTDITHFFKIVGRTHPKSMVIRTVRAYMNQIWEGDLLDIVSGSLYGIGIDFGAHLDNVSLTQAHFFEKITSCDRNCESCGFCAELAGKLVSFKVVTRGKLEDLGLKDLCDNLEREGKLID